MDDKLATGLLDKVMNWSVDKAKTENIVLQTLARSRYDDYKQFTTGMRFIESLARWLRQFEDDEKNLAYSFIRKNLVFISEKEMNHLVEISFYDYIQQFLIQQISEQTNIPEWKTKKIVNSKEYSKLLRQCLFLGLSDGSHIDDFRRNIPMLSTEQVFRTHEITEQRAISMLDALKTDLTKILEREPNEDELKFKIIFLLDDFSASGISYIRQETPRYKGKIARFYYDLTNQPDTEKEKECTIPTSQLIDIDDVQICAMLYIITPHSLDYIRTMCHTLFDKIPFHVLFTYLLPDTIHLEDTNSEFINFLEKYKDDSIINEHFRKGKHSKSFLGYDHCALPLILYHNTPNNSLPLLWYEYNHPDRKYVGLFPRVSRHQ